MTSIDVQSSIGSIFFSNLYKMQLFGNIWSKHHKVWKHFLEIMASKRYTNFNNLLRNNRILPNWKKVPKLNDLFFASTKYIRIADLANGTTILKTWKCWTFQSDSLFISLYCHFIVDQYVKNSFSRSRPQMINP